MNTLKTLNGKVDHTIELQRYLLLVRSDAGRGSLTRTEGCSGALIHFLDNKYFGGITVTVFDRASAADLTTADFPSIGMRETDDERLKNLFPGMDWNQVALRVTANTRRPKEIELIFLDEGRFSIVTFLVRYGAVHSKMFEKELKSTCEFRRRTP